MGNGTRQAAQTQETIPDPDVVFTCTCCWHKCEDHWERPKLPAHPPSSGCSELVRLNLLCCSTDNILYKRIEKNCWGKCHLSYMAALSPLPSYLNRESSLMGSSKIIKSNKSYHCCIHASVKEDVFSLFKPSELLNTPSKLFTDRLHRDSTRNTLCSSFIPLSALPQIITWEMCLFLHL